MTHWREELFDILLCTNDEQQLFKQVHSISRDLGFEHYAYGIKMPVPFSRPLVALNNNYCSSWNDHYHEKKYIDVDPTVAHAKGSTGLLVWSDELFRDTKEFWSDAQDHGLRHGIALPSRDPNGAIGMLTLARDHIAIKPKHLSSIRLRIAWLTHTCHTIMARILMPRLVPESSANMTAREKEILRWIAEGKTTEEIGKILTISSSTVNFHIKNILVKLNSLNKTQAVAKAIALGLLF